MDSAAPSNAPPAVARTPRTVDRKMGMSGYVISVANWQDYPDWLFEPEPDLDACGSNASASRSWVDIRDASTDAPLNTFCSLSTPQDLLGIWFAVRRGEPVPANVYVSIWDRYSGVVASSEATPPAPPLVSPPPS